MAFHYAPGGVADHHGVRVFRDFLANRVFTVGDHTFRVRVGAIGKLAVARQGDFVARGIVGCVLCQISTRFFTTQLNALRHNIGGMRAQRKSRFSAFAVVDRVLQIVLIEIDVKAIDVRRLNAIRLGTQRTQRVVDFEMFVTELRDFPGFGIDFHERKQRFGGTKHVVTKADRQLRENRIDDAQVR